MNKNKKLLIIIVFILFILIFFLTYILLNKHIEKDKFESQLISFSNKNERVIFQINKIIFFSNCDAKYKTSSASNFTLENLYQYTDIAIFIKNNDTENTLENTLKSVCINNIKFNVLPSLGTPNLYFKGFSQFAKSEYVDNNIIQNTLDFNITSENEADLNTPTLYNNLANPITLSYINSNIKSDYTLTDTSSPITYDGSLLKRCNIPLDSINCSLSFDIYITNNKDEDFKCTLYIDIPLQNEEKNIYDGNIIVKKDTNFLFYRYK